MRRLFETCLGILKAAWHLFSGILFRLLELASQALPESSLGCRIRAVIYRPFLKSCGRNFQVALACKLEHLAGIQVGNDVYIGHGSWISGLRGGIKLADEVMLGPYVTAISSNHTNRAGSFRFGRGQPGQIEIGPGTWVAAGSTLIAGIKIGTGCLIAAGSVVSQDVPDHTVVGGVPARQIAPTKTAD